MRKLFKWLLPCLGLIIFLVCFEFGHRNTSYWRSQSDRIYSEGVFYPDKATDIILRASRADPIEGLNAPVGVVVVMDMCMNVNLSGPNKEYLLEWVELNKLKLGFGLKEIEDFSDSNAQLWPDLELPKNPQGPNLFFGN